MASLVFVCVKWSADCHPSGTTHCREEFRPIVIFFECIEIISPLLFKILLSFLLYFPLVVIKHDPCAWLYSLIMMCLGVDKIPSCLPSLGFILGMKIWILHCLWAPVSPCAFKSCPFLLAFSLSSLLQDIKLSQQNLRMLLCISVLYFSVLLTNHVTVDPQLYLHLCLCDCQTQWVLHIDNFSFLGYTNCCVSLLAFPINGVKLVLVHET